MKTLIIFLCLCSTVALADPTNGKDPDYFNMDAALNYWYVQTFGKMPESELWVLRADKGKYVYEAWNVKGHTAPTMAALQSLTSGVNLREWLNGETEPPVATPLLVVDSGDGKRFELDTIGNARDGVRTPCVDVPTQILSGVVTADVPRICVLFGVTTPLPPTVIAGLYTGDTDYVQRYADAVDAAIEAGFVLSADRDELLADARTDLVVDAEAFR